MADPAGPAADAEMAEAARAFAAGRHDDARARCEAILARDARHFWALHLSGALALARRDIPAALDFTARALAISPDDADVLANHGAALRQAGRPAEALALYERMLAQRPDSPPALLNRGVALQALNRHAEAIASFDRVLALRPGDPTARFHRALSRLTLGDLAAGFEDHEARYGGSPGQTPRRKTWTPEWTGRESLEGRGILVHAEQGLGDSIQMLRYCEPLQARGARVHLEMPPALRTLAATAPGVASVGVPGETRPACDFHIPAMSLPRAFGTRMDTIPGTVPYLRVDPERVARWRERLGPARKRIGIAWSGNPGQLNDANRSMPLEALAPLRALDAQVVALQKDLRDGDAATLARFGWPHFGDDLRDLADTAALVECMDLVVSVDTSVAHLAGALGRETWVLLCFAADWRYHLERTDSPWYPTMRLFRQAAPGEWGPLVEDVAARLGAGTVESGPQRRFDRQLAGALKMLLKRLGPATRR